ncbi:MAG: cache domain-containing protein [Vicinamibacteria bacterium]|nr:cache domain-containing protein [Vicinamibacteria bacterium]
MNAPPPIAHHNSIRTVLVVAVLAFALVPALVIGAIGVRGLTASVSHEAQQRVDRDLEIVATSFGQRLGRLASSLEVAASRVQRAESRDEALAALRRELALSVLNLCDAEGRPLAGAHAPGAGRVPVDRDPVLRQALQGRAAWGAVALDAGRLQQEGGPALRQAARVTDAEGVEATGAGLAWWIAVPLTGPGGRVEALLYGGRLLNHDPELVDALRDLVFGAATDGPARGAVTLFLGDVRVATNVRGADGARAVGTRVSEPVREAVLARGGSYAGEALVVDAWYLSAYRPLAEPDGRIVGMLYVGLARAPYDAMSRDLIVRFLAPVAVVALLAVWGALYIVNRITRPLRVLGESAARLADGDWDHELEVPASYVELEHLAEAYAGMREAIRRRDLELRERNRELSAANEQLAQSNRNYMQTLGFVTHELKAPLGAMQMLIGTLMEGHAGALPDPASRLLLRIQRNCEELQDMVRDYLDLSRLEHGELVASRAEIDLARDVVRPAVENTAVFFRSRDIALEVECPGALPAVADPGLLRIALNNFLTNAAKYGREKGHARLTVHAERGEAALCLWNEGPGFPPETAERLFEKFFRVRDAHTHSRRGSGIGLFTVRRIAELHGGRAWAESEPGAWAAFHLRFPLRPAEPAPPATPV